MTSRGLPPSESLRVYDNILGTIGKTPMVRLNNLGRNLKCGLYVKVEFFNPGGSIKDRIALNIIEDAERNGELKPGGTVVEATSGNTGVGLAIIASMKGYKTVFVMPDKMSQEKIQLLRAFGARVVITPTSVAPEDPRSYYNVAKQIVDNTPNAILANQYHNPENPNSHFESTGPEIWEQSLGKVTDVVIGMGTGGTISGVGRYLKSQNPAIQIVGVDATGSILREIWEHKGQIPKGVEATTYKVEGIGEDFLPSTTDLSVVDQVLRVTDKESFLCTRRLVKEEGIFCGGSSGAAVAAALRYAKDLPENRCVVVILPDSGSRYLSKIFDDKWLREHGYLESEWSDITLQEVLTARNLQELISVSIKDRKSDVIALMKTHDISQVPVLGTDGSVVGLVTEIDLLKHMLSVEHDHSIEETIEDVMQPPPPEFPGEAHLEVVISAIVENNVVLVMNGTRVNGILTKIDVLDFIYH